MSKKIYDWIYKNDNYHWLTQEEHDTLKKIDVFG